MEFYGERKSLRFSLIAGAGKCIFFVKLSRQIA